LGVTPLCLVDRYQHFRKLQPSSSG